MTSSTPIRLKRDANYADQRDVYAQPPKRSGSLPRYIRPAIDGRQGDPRSPRADGPGAGGAAERQRTANGCRWSAWEIRIGGVAKRLRPPTVCLSGCGVADGYPLVPWPVTMDMSPTCQRAWGFCTERPGRSTWRGPGGHNQKGLASASTGRTCKTLGHPHPEDGREVAPVCPPGRRPREAAPPGAAGPMGIAGRWSTRPSSSYLGMRVETDTSEFTRRTEAASSTAMSSSASSWVRLF
jgi:hypothetical protein